MRGIKLISINMEISQLDLKRHGGWRNLIQFGFGFEKRGLSDSFQTTLQKEKMIQKKKQIKRGENGVTKTI